MDVKQFILSDEEREEKHSAAAKFFAEKAVYRVPAGQPWLLGKAPGTRYAWQMYSRKAMFNPEFAENVATLALDMLATEIGNFDFQLGGLETAAVPVMCAIQAHARVRGVDINVVSVRKNRKDYGLFNWIEGDLNSKPVLLVDDICNSTESLRTAMRVLGDEYKALFLNRTFTLVNKCNRGAPNISYDKNMPDTFEALYLFDLDDIGLRM
jgi:hypothetical protein